MTEMFETSVKTWPDVVNKRFIDRLEANTIATPRDTYSLGGVKGRWISSGHFNFESPDQALVIKIPDSPAKYQAIQLTDVWFASMEYGNQVSSLNRTQSKLSEDGAFYYVISQSDPGHSNWLDSGVYQRGTILIRWDGMNRPLTLKEMPTATLTSIDNISKIVPAMETVNEQQRHNTRAQRRRHIQLRSNR